MWSCNACTYKNSPLTDVCGVCMTPRGFDYEPQAVNNFSQISPPRSAPVRADASTLDDFETKYDFEEQRNGEDASDGSANENVNKSAKEDTSSGLSDESEFGGGAFDEGGVDWDNVDEDDFDGMDNDDDDGDWDECEIGDEDDNISPLQLMRGDSSQRPKTREELRDEAVKRQMQLSEFKAKMKESTVEVVMKMLQILRTCPTSLAPLDSAVANYDLAKEFVDCYIDIVKMRGPDFRKVKIVFHWTREKNFGAIIDGNLKVPDGVKLAHQTDTGYYGKGIYTSPEANYAQGYGGGAKKMFICLSVPGKVHTSIYPQDNGGPCREGFDTHMSADRGNNEWVFFKSAQLLPCFLVDPTTAAGLSQVLQEIVDLIDNANLNFGDFWNPVTEQPNPEQPEKKKMTKWHRFLSGDKSSSKSEHVVPPEQGSNSSASSSSKYVSYFPAPKERENDFSGSNESEENSTQQASSYNDQKARARQLHSICTEQPDPEQPEKKKKMAKWRKFLSGDKSSDTSNNVERPEKGSDSSAYSSQGSVSPSLASKERENVLSGGNELKKNSGKPSTDQMSRTTKQYLSAARSETSALSNPASGENILAETDGAAFTSKNTSKKSKKKRRKGKRK